MMAPSAKKTVLITGCSKGGLGSALALAFHARNLRVIATARDPQSITHLKERGLDTLSLDVLSPASIAEAVRAVSKITNGSLDILLNNAGANYAMPLVDASLQSARDTFELNVWSMLAMVQAFTPLLLRSRNGGGMIVNQTSISSVSTVPMTGIYNASKAAAAALTENLRLELAPFCIKVVDLKTGAVKSNFLTNTNKGAKPELPTDSLYNVAKEAVEKSMAGGDIDKATVPSEKWAGQVVNDLLKSDPDIRIWRGGNAWLMWFARRFMPFTFLDDTMAKMGGLNVVKQNLAAAHRK